MNNKIAIIGSGYCGLAAATRLVAKGYDISIFESSDKVGGLAGGYDFHNHDWSMERFYHHWFKNEKGIKEICSRLNIYNQIDFYSTKTSFLHSDGIKPFDKPTDVLSYPGLSLIDRYKLGKSLAEIKLKKNWIDFDKITAEEWIKSNMGKNVYERLWKPMLIGKWGEEYNQINMAWFWARIHVRTKTLMYPKGGFQRFNNLIKERLKSLGVKFFFNTKVKKLKLENSTYKITSEQRDFDSVLLTVSPSILKKLLMDENDKYIRKINQIPSVGAICMIIRLKRRVLKNSYWLNIPSVSTNPISNKVPFLIFVEHTNLIDPSYYNNEHIVYCANYLKKESELYNMGNEQIFELYLNGINVINPNIYKDDVLDYKISKTEYASPIFLVNHKSRVPSFETPLKNVYWASMNHIYPWDRGTNYAAELGFEVASHIINSK